LRAGGSFVAGLLVLSPFLFDAGLTLVRRALRREVLWRAHRSHLYQRLIATGWTHLRVAVLYSVWTLFAGALACAWPAPGVSELRRAWILSAAAAPCVLLVGYVYWRERGVTQQAQQSARAAS